MTNEEAKAIIRKEYLCVDRDCDIEKNCGKCDLMMPSKEPILEAYKMAIKALEQEPCEDCIDRATAMTEIMMSKRIASFDGEYWIKTKDATQIIRELPRAEQEPKTGHWISGKYKDTCSRCRCTYPKNIGFKNYCPNCGCRMVEPQERSNT